MTNGLSLLYLWDQRTLYLGDLTGFLEVTQAAASLLIGLEGDIEFWTPDQPEHIKARSALIPAGIQASADNMGLPVAVCYLDPCNLDFHHLTHMMSRQESGIYFDSVHEKSQLGILGQMYQEQPPPQQAYRQLMDQVLLHPVEPRLPDQRHETISRAISIIKANPMENMSNQDLADQLGMTENQLQKQFKAIVGIPIRRYRLWHRLFVTATLMGFGMSLTEAALQAGFSDSSHFNHTFRSMLGMKPSFVLKRRDQMRILIGGDNQSHEESPLKQCQC